MRKLRRLRELSSHERWLLLHALCLLPLARLGLALGGFNRTHWLFQRLAPVRPRAVQRHDAEALALATARLVRVAAVYGLCSATCLPRSLVTVALLRRHGLSPALRLGARKRAGVLEAHAWVVLGRLTLGHDTSDDGDPFSPFETGALLDGHDTATC